MTDIFISYSRELDQDDYVTAGLVHDRLTSVGLDVFVDREILPGKDWDQVLNGAVRQAKLVIALWSRRSLESTWVRNECRTAKERGVLVPILIEKSAESVIPIEFNNLQFQEFDVTSEVSWREFISSLSKLLSDPELITRFELSIRPLIAESTTAESAGVATILHDLERERLVIPDYQRGSGEWSDNKKAIFVESIINNLAIPAFFFEPFLREGREINQVVDGQQRLTTLEEFYRNRFKLPLAPDEPYISPNSLYYAGKYFRDLPASFQQAFESYRLTIIKLRNLGAMRQEVFRRINSGGQPLSAHDIRLAYYGKGSRTLALVRLVGVFNTDSDAAKRFLSNADREYGIGNPWSDATARLLWRDWWSGKDLAKGQAASEMFLFALASASAKRLNRVASDREALAKLGISQSRTLDDALNIYAARTAFEESDVSIKAQLPPYDEVSKKFFPYFQECFLRFQSGKQKISITHRRAMALAIGAMYRVGLKAKEIDGGKADVLRKLILAPAPLCEEVGIKWPVGKGVWHGSTGHHKQMEAAGALLRNKFRKAADPEG